MSSFYWTAVEEWKKHAVQYLLWIIYIQSVRQLLNARYVQPWKSYFRDCKNSEVTI